MSGQYKLYLDIGRMKINIHGLDTSCKIIGGVYAYKPDLNAKKNFPDTAATRRR